MFLALLVGRISEKLEKSLLESNTMCFFLLRHGDAYSNLFLDCQMLGEVHTSKNTLCTINSPHSPASSEAPALPPYTSNN